MKNRTYATVVYIKLILKHSPGCLCVRVVAREKFVIALKCHRGKRRQGASAWNPFFKQFTPPVFSPDPFPNHHALPGGGGAGGVIRKGQQTD